MANQVSKVMAKAKGALRGAGKALSGQTGILRHLAAEHGEVDAILDRIQSGDAKQRADLLPTLRENLLAHAKAEEQEFYPVLETALQRADLLARALEQHQAIERDLELLSGEDKMGADWTRLSRNLAHSVEQHVHFEEEEIFPLLEAQLDRARLSDMLDHYKAAESRERERLRG